ncbi:hypothetical protein F5J12DRAFT_438787 [Pisolithus orientalis]|uniref:uncharacterized protein n=1 Tax=Pisolithus orientalis TaxID=936130 RepID=UPI0022242EEB|nr:uncharacterized protein F5J12DRAFT_438787 [Pisolithus orientalis]KAI6025575.1 hypothetical protein F5J12DRAFT_438787 [Pisolithus orientalis]
MPRTKQTARKTTGGTAPRNQFVIVEETPEPSQFNHIFSQTQQNIEHLIAYNQIPQDEGRDILAKLGARSPTSSTSAHIISQTRQNVELLIAYDQIPRVHGRDILARLSHAGSLSSTSVTDLTQKASDLSISPPLTTGVQAVTLDSWRSEDPSDLSFRAGEVIEIVSEAEEYWWIGRNQAGKEGGFPPVYVKKVFDDDD